MRARRSAAAGAGARAAPPVAAPEPPAVPVPPTPVAAPPPEPVPKLKRSKSDKFVGLVEARTGKAVEAIRVVGNLSNRGAYEWTDAQVAQVTAALRAAVDDVEKRFSTARARVRAPFRLG